MTFCSKYELKEKLNQVFFFAISGGKIGNSVVFPLISFKGGIGTILGGGYGLMKGIPLYKILPSTIFKSTAFFATISGNSKLIKQANFCFYLFMFIQAIQGALEIGRKGNKSTDSLNPLIAGGWTGFIFGHGVSTS